LGKVLISILTANLGCGSAAPKNSGRDAVAALRCAGAARGYAYDNGSLRHVPATGQA
jgi:hypothetical protein